MKKLSFFKTDAEVASIKLLMNQSQKEMTEYINHLETLVNNSQEALEKNKLKLKENNQILSRLKTDNEALDKQYQCEVKLHNKMKEELEACCEKLESMHCKFAQTEAEKKRLDEIVQSLSISEKKAQESLNSVIKDCTRLQTENNTLKEKMEIYSKDRDESLKEQKDLINKYAILSKELQKLQDKYRHVKAECNERANVIKYLEMMLKENMIEYNNKIAHLENNITNILNKIAACKNTMKEKQVGSGAEVKELRQQLDITYQERKELEHVVNEYYTAMKHLENEIQSREKEVDELHLKLSMELQKRNDKNQEDKLQGVIEDGSRSEESLKIKQLQSEILIVENELTESKKKLKQNELNHENEKKKLELVSGNNSDKFKCNSSNPCCRCRYS